MEANERTGRSADTERRLKMSATLKLTHKAIGVEVRRGTYDAVVDGERVGSVEMNDTTEIPIESWSSQPASAQRPKLEPHSELRRGRGPGRRVPVHRKEVLADLSRVVRRATPGAFAPSAVAGALRVDRFLSRSSWRAPVQSDAACASPPIAHAADEPMPDWVAPPEPGR